MPEALPSPIHLRVPSHLAWVRPVRKMLEGLLDAQGWIEDDVDDAALILTEIVQNAVEHGSRGTGDEEIHVRILAGERRVEFEVEDPGTGIDPQLAVHRDLETPVPLDEPRGRGLFLINRLAGGLERSVTAEGGLRLKACKEART